MAMNMLRRLPLRRASIFGVSAGLAESMSVTEWRGAAAAFCIEILNSADSVGTKPLGFVSEVMWIASTKSAYAKLCPAGFDNLVNDLLREAAVVGQRGTGAVGSGAGLSVHLGAAQ